MFKKLSVIFSVVIVFLFAFNLAKAATLSERLSGKILLQVESHGEAWYVNPVNDERYFLGRPADAFALMRELGLGISNKDFASFGDKAPARLAGRILLKVEDAGKAYYVNPADLTTHYLGRPADAFAVMRELGLGITDADLAKITVATGHDIPAVAEPPADTGNESNGGEETVSCPADACEGSAWRAYTVSEGECVYSDDDCSDCSCACGGYNTEESIENSNCGDGLDNDCDGDADTADSGCATNGTVVSGVLTGGTWTEANSPYLAEGVVIMDPGTDITIEPGVTVKFANDGDTPGKLIVRGNLTAEGSADKHIVFTSAASDPRAGDWDGITVVDGGYVDLGYAEVKYAVTGLNAPNAMNLAVSDSSFTDNGTGLLSSGPAVISGNTFERNDAGLVYSGTTASDDDLGTFMLFTDRLSDIENNIIRDNTGEGVDAGGFIIKDVTQAGYVLRFRYNLITDNNVGVRFVDSTYFTRLTIEKNDIYDNTVYNVRCENEAPRITMSDNWWGTTVYDEIDASIYDYSDSTTLLPIVDYKPIKFGPVSGLE